MIRNTLDAGSVNAKTAEWAGYGGIYFDVRATSGGSTTEPGRVSATLPYWVKVSRSGSTFSSYASADGVNWVQLGTNQTITMGQTVYVGLAVTSGSASALATATFDNVSVSSVSAPAPVISSVSATTGSIGSQVVISGTGFGALQGNSVVTLNGAVVTINTWSATSISITIPAGAPSMNDSNPVIFTVTSQPLPTSWLDQDVGLVGVAGSASYSAGTFTVQGPGTQIFGTTDAFHYVYKPLTGDGTVVARLVSLQGGASYVSAGVMIRNTLDAGSVNAKTADWPTFGGIYFDVRATSGGSTTEPGRVIATLPYWVKMSRSGSTFSSYASTDGVNWVQLGTNQTITMGQTVYVGLAVTSGSTTALATATFDNVAISTATAPAPNFTLSTSPSSVMIAQGASGTSTIAVIPQNGFNGNVSFSASGLPSGVTASFNPTSTASTSTLTLTASGTATTGTVTVTITGLSGTLTKTTTISLNVRSIPTLPSVWTDGDIGSVGVAGSASYANGTFTVAGAGLGTFFTNSDGFHFAYQPLSGDGTMVARVVSLQGSSAAQAGIMIRDTLNAGANHVYLFNYSSTTYMTERTSTGASSTYQSLGSGTLPNWIRLARSGNVFTMYGSPDGVNWVQLGTSQTVSMAQNVYVGLAVSNRTTSSLATASFDNVSVSAPVASAPVITAVSATTGSIGSPVVISGSGFGASQGGSAVLLNGAAVTINTWSGTSISITIPVGATSGPLLVSIAPSMNDSNAVRFTVTSQPLPVSWLDQDV